jgi:hypothetical protein
MTTSTGIHAAIPGAAQQGSLVSLHGSLDASLDVSPESTHMATHNFRNTVSSSTSSSTSSLSNTLSQYRITPPVEFGVSQGNAQQEKQAI